MFSLQAWSCQQPCGKLLLCKQHTCSQPCHTGTHTVSHTHTESCVKLHCDSTQSRVSCPKCPPESPPLSCVCQSVRPVPESAFRSVCAAERRQRGPAPAPAGPASRCVCSVSAAAHSWICDCLLPESADVPDVPDEMFCVVFARWVRKCNMSH